MSPTYADTSSIKDLVVIDLPHADTVRLDDWDWKRKHFFPAENCDRQLLIGFVDDLKHIPQVLREKADNNPRHYDGNRPIIAQGEEAYKHLLRVTCGMLDKNLGEKQTFQNIQANWNSFIQSEEGKVRQERFERIVKDFTDDTRTIRGKVFQDRKAGFYLQAVSTEPAVAARNLIQPGKRRTVLVICEKDGITGNTFKVLDNCADTIYLTHPDQAKCDEYANQFRGLGYKSTIEIIPYEEVMQRMPEGVDIVFNCQPMDNGANDRTMIQWWKSRKSGGDAVLVHLKGNPHTRNTTSEAWQKAHLQGVFFVEDIHRQKQRDLEHNSKIIEHAEIAITNCTTSRRFSRRPVDAINKDTGQTHLLNFPSYYEQMVMEAANTAQRFKQRAIQSRQKGGEALQL